MSAPLHHRPTTVPADFVDCDLLDDIDELEDTQPSVLLPDADDEFGDAPTVPGFKLRADGSVEYDDGSRGWASDHQWDIVLRAVALAVRRIFASHSIS